MHTGFGMKLGSYYIRHNIVLRLYIRLCVRHSPQQWFPEYQCIFFTELAARLVSEMFLCLSFYLSVECSLVENVFCHQNMHLLWYWNLYTKSKKSLDTLIAAVYSDGLSTWHNLINLFEKKLVLVFLFAHIERFRVSCVPDFCISKIMESKSLNLLTPQNYWNRFV